MLTSAYTVSESYDVTSSASVHERAALDYDIGWLMCLFGTRLGYPTTFHLDGSEYAYEMRDQIEVPVGSHELTFRTVHGVPAPAPLTVVVRPRETVFVLVKYFDPNRPEHPVVIDKEALDGPDAD